MTLLLCVLVMATVAMFCCRCYRDGIRERVPAVVVRYDAEDKLKSATRLNASHSVREGMIVGAKLTVSGGDKHYTLMLTSAVSQGNPLKSAVPVC